MTRVDPRGGFTLIELMIVVIIVGLLAAIAIPRFNAVADQARQSEAVSILKHMCGLADVVRLRDGVYPASLSGLEGWMDPGAEYFSFDYANGVATAKGGDGALQPVSGMVDQSMDCMTRELN